MPSKRDAESTGVPSPGTSKKSKSTVASQPTISSFFSRSAHASGSAASQSKLSCLSEKPAIRSSNDEPPKIVASAGLRTTVDPNSVSTIQDEMTQLERDAEVARNLAGEDDQAYYERFDRSPLKNFGRNPSAISTSVAILDSVPPRIPEHDRATRQESKTITSPQSQTPVHYPLDLDILEFQPSQIDVSTWPLLSSCPSSPRKKPAAKAKSREESASALSNLQARTVSYSFLVAGFVMISATRSRLLITTILTNLLRTVIEYDSASVLPTIYLITNHLGPAYEGIELGIGTQVLTKAIRGVSDVSNKELKSLWNTHGDPGDVAFEARKSIRTLFNTTAQLTVRSVFDDLHRLSKMKGPGTVDTKADVVKKLLVSAKGEEVRYLVRTICRNLRIGAVKLTVTASLARAFCLSRPPSKSFEESRFKKYWIQPQARRGIRAVINKDLKGKAKAVEEGKRGRQEILQILTQAEKLVREVYVRHPNYDTIIPALLEDGSLDTLSERVVLVVGIPISPMLGQITRDLSDVEHRLRPDEEFVAEWKYDGQRVQIHAKKGIGPASDGTGSGGGKWLGPQKDIFVRLFSRHLEDITEKYPDVLDLVVALFEKKGQACLDEKPHIQSTFECQKCLSSFILDAEICAIDPATGQLKTFQTLSNRSRKDVKIEDVNVQVGIFAFDLMYLNGKSLLEEPFRNRRSLLKTNLPPFIPPKHAYDLNVANMTARFEHVTSLESTVHKLDEVKEFMMEAIANKCEGIMIKVLDSQTPLQKTDGLVVEPSRGDHLVESDLDREDDVASAASEQGGEGEFGGISRVETKRSRKTLMASYEPDKRVDSWLKVKKDYGELGDSLDLVPIAAWHGQGRKARWWSPILLALYDPESGGFQAVCKCISGFSDQFYKDLGARYVKGSDRCSESQLGYIESSGEHDPDVWFLPSEVWEIRGADITLSPVYKAAQGLVDPDRGLSLRFPRFYRIREDKAVEDASHPEDFAEMWRRQERGA